MDYIKAEQLKGNKSSRNLGQNIRQQLTGRQLASGNHRNRHRRVKHTTRYVATYHNGNCKCGTNSNAIAAREMIKGPLRAFLLS